MRSRSMVRRCLIVVWAVLQLAVPLAASHADAGRSVRGADERAHVEDASAAGCVAMHTGDCAICKQLSTVSVAAAAAALDVPDRWVAKRMPASPAGLGSIWRDPALARAPPTVL